GVKTPRKAAVTDPEPTPKPENRFNDGKCDPAGRLWAGTISTVKNEGTANLYALEGDHSCSLKFSGVTNSNGLAWSKDGSTMFYIDTPTKKIRAFDFDATAGTIENERIVIDTECYEGSPDGMTIDSEDRLWIAFCRGSSVLCIDPTNADLVSKVELPVSGTTSCCFGGAKLDTLYITTGIFANLDEPGAGLQYAVKPGVTGTPTIAFNG
ncbi:MAG: SMP-30/gluconolactonase/LRE family protein, partial [Verrucomicrobiota bacterium]